MARLNHVLFGQAKGKVGGMVLQRYEGMNIAREKPITVKNPQSESQTVNRSKFKLASQTVGIYKEVINARLAKASIYTRMRRGMAVEAVKRIITSTDPTVAVENFSEAISAINAKSLTEYSAPTVVLNGSNFDVTAPSGSEILGVIAGFDDDGKFVGRKVVSATADGSAQQFAIPNDYEMTKAMFVYSVPQTEEGRAIYNNIVDPDAEFQVSITRLVSSGDAGISDIAGVTKS